MATSRRGRNGAGIDRISALPDELLICILTRLGCTQAAARTSVLSRRWRHLWTHLRNISLTDRTNPSASAPSILDTIDRAISACVAPVLDRLDLYVMYDRSRPVTAARVAPWLPFASQRLFGRLRLSISARWNPSFGHDQELELPVCRKATDIGLDIRHFSLQPMIPATGTFAELRALRIACFSFRKLDLERVILLQCPRLKKLTLMGLMESFGVADLSIRSDSLERLELCIRVLDQLNVEAPRLVRLEILKCLYDDRVKEADSISAARIVAPKLAEVIWHTAYDSRCDQIIGTGRHLRRLEVMTFYNEYAFEAPTPWVGPAVALLQRFDSADELDLHVSIPREIIDYENFVKDTIKLPKCKALNIRLEGQAHAIVSTVLHLLHKCAEIRRLDIQLLSTLDKGYTCSSGCPCGLSENQISDDIVLNSLEEVYINRFRGEDHEVDLLRLLFSCKAIPKRVAICASYSLNKETCNKIASFSHKDTRVEFNGTLDGRYGRHIYTWSPSYSYKRC